MTSDRLTDKAIVIVGGTTGLGRSAAEACARNGGRVVVVGRTAATGEEALAALGDVARLLVGDATDPETALLAIAAAVEAFGRCDGLYHVAGGSGRAAGDGPLDDIAARTRRCLEHVPPEKLALAPDCGLSQTARWAARQKLANLVAGVRQVREELGL